MHTHHRSTSSISVVVSKHRLIIKLSTIFNLHLATRAPTVMQLAVITLVLSLCFMVAMAYPSPYYTTYLRSRAGAQELTETPPVAAGYPYMPLDAERIRAQINPEQLNIPTSREELLKCANQDCKGGLKHFNTMP